jgi:hypothetical protein
MLSIASCNSTSKSFSPDWSAGLQAGRYADLQVGDVRTADTRRPGDRRSGRPGDRRSGWRSEDAEDPRPQRRDHALSQELDTFFRAVYLERPDAFRTGSEVPSIGVANVHNRPVMTSEKTVRTRRLCEPSPDTDRVSTGALAGPPLAGRATAPAGGRRAGRGGPRGEAA